MSDAETTVIALQHQVAQFARERDWERFHTLKDLAMSVSIEAAELLELFLWKTPVELEAMAHHPEMKQRMAEELADVVIYCLNFANRMDLNLAEAVAQKLVANAEKYPADSAKGSSSKYTEV